MSYSNVSGFLTFCKFFHYFRVDKRAMMRKWIIFPISLILICCTGKNNDTYFTPDKASRYFKEIEEICNRDSGKLWGLNLYGPIMFVERGTRRIVANQSDNDGLLKSKEGVYTGIYPKELILSNAPVKFGGTQFAMVPLPPEDDAYRIKTRAIHSLFHRYQENQGVTSEFFNSGYMDEKEARFWIKLEWKALRKAINSSGEERQLAIRDALIFRGSNRERYHKYIDDANSFETYEGLPTFTYTLLCTNSHEEFKEKLFENLDRVYSMQSYARSYGFIHGALYASLLYDKGFDLKTIQTDNFDLGNAVKELYNIELPAICRDVAGSLAVNYDVDIINKEEEKRDTEIGESIHKLASTFTEKPVVFLELESPYFDFEPEDVFPLDTIGTLYNSMRVSDNWGKLTVEKGGCLVSNNLKFIRITAKSFKEDKYHVSGEGWHLILYPGWQLIPVDNNYFVSKLMP
jgi:hypothetical protein